MGFQAFLLENGSHSPSLETTQHLHCNPNDPLAPWETCRDPVLTVHLLLASSAPRQTQGPAPAPSDPTGALQLPHLV